MPYNRAAFSDSEDEEQSYQESEALPPGGPVPPWYDPMNKISLPNEITPLPTKCTLCPLFHSLPRPPPSLPRPPILSPALYVCKASCSSLDLGQLKVETHRFRWKEIDVFLQLLSLSCHGERNRWQIISTEAESHGLAEVQFMSRDLFKFQTR